MKHHMEMYVCLYQYYFLPKYVFPNAKSYVANNFAAVGKAMSLVGMGIHRVLVHVFDVGTNRVAWLASMKIIEGGMSNPKRGSSSAAVTKLGLTPTLFCHSLFYHLNESKKKKHIYRERSIEDTVHLLWLSWAI